MKHQYSVYIITNQNKTVLYTGVTNDLAQRLVEHYLNRGKADSFTGKYHCFYLLYHESHRYIRNAIEREKEIKSWYRAKKEELIREFNPEFLFLNSEVMEWPPKEAFTRNEGA